VYSRRPREIPDAHRAERPASASLARVHPRVARSTTADTNGATAWSAGWARFTRRAPCVRACVSVTGETDRPRPSWAFGEALPPLQLLAITALFSRNRNLWNIYLLCACRGFGRFVGSRPTKRRRTARAQQVLCALAGIALPLPLL
jgi:hypothetical protein